MSATEGYSMETTLGRRKARRVADIDPDVLAALQSGTMQTATLVESFAIDFAVLMACVFPELRGLATGKINREDGITRRMAMAAILILEHVGPSAFESLARHPSDTVRGWAAYLLAATPALDLTERLQRVRPLARDAHFGVREWAWIAMRPHVAADLERAIAVFIDWVAAPEPNVRRFAVEITRPRGVWCTHINALKLRPEIGLPLLQPLASEPVRYVQDSVANWLNDAAKSIPCWVRDLCDECQSSDCAPATRFICRRGQRSISMTN
jgi:3-methyladenine DNA glycosylase AlkC